MLREAIDRTSKRYCGKPPGLRTDAEQPPRPVHVGCCFVLLVDADCCRIPMSETSTTKGFSWCCGRGLNSRPLPYQGSGHPQQHQQVSSHLFLRPQRIHVWVQADQPRGALRLSAHCASNARLILGPTRRPCGRGRGRRARHRDASTSRNYAETHGRLSGAERRLWMLGRPRQAGPSTTRPCESGIGARGDQVRADVRPEPSVIAGPAGCLGFIR
jgi:hypothetical protein